MTTSRAPASTAAPGATQASVTRPCSGASSSAGGERRRRVARRAGAGRSRRARRRRRCQWPTSPSTARGDADLPAIDRRRRRRSASACAASRQAGDAMRSRRRSVAIERRRACRPGARVASMPPTPIGTTRVDRSATTTSRPRAAAAAGAAAGRATPRRALRATTAPASRAPRRRRSGGRGTSCRALPAANSAIAQHARQEGAIGRHAEADGRVERVGEPRDGVGAASARGRSRAPSIES